MKNKLIKTVSWTLCILVLTLCAGIAGYEITRYRLNGMREISNGEPGPAEEAIQSSAAQKPADAMMDVEFEYYIARMNGRNLGIFVCSNNIERLAYDLEVDFNSLSESDRALLKQGIVLYNDEELAKFTEDFTS